MISRGMLGDPCFSERAKFRRPRGASSNRRSPFSRGEDSPRGKAGFRHHTPSGLGDRDQMGEETRLAPGHRARRRADGPILVRVVGLHQDRADAVGAKMARQIAAGQPFAFEIAAHLGSRRINGATRRDAISAFRSGWFFQLLDLERGAAHRAFATGLARSRRQGLASEGTRRIARSRSSRSSIENETRRFTEEVIDRNRALDD